MLMLKGVKEPQIQEACPLPKPNVLWFGGVKPASVTELHPTNNGSFLRLKF